MKLIGFLTIGIMAAVFVIPIHSAYAADKSGNILTGILDVFKGEMREQ